MQVGPDGGTGRRAGLKIRFSQESGSSTLPLGTIEIKNWIDTDIECNHAQYVQARARSLKELCQITELSVLKMKYPLDSAILLA